MYISKKNAALEEANSHDAIERSAGASASQIAAQAVMNVDVSQHPSVTFSLDIAPIENLTLTTHESYAIRVLTLLLDSFADGMGIGLTVARSIAHRLGGDIRLRQLQ